ncbi:peptidoglycan-binding protein LysM [Flavobacteriaceae bacterium S0825]|uniref:peptidoglycan-binding protein LysM n=1 Tax=Gaetbulibacter sp. S0825 TaxID=2720084 RepID=UPI0014317F54|nr:peptidoglycan-binding protein LysM [Gaetbulibacter sp. S0825]MCK0109157.1 peptidoglycan-binding protein LysM [Flavobacteriaceae bacterium S0825]NIX64792.1 peptidoglycan-binding protein LysM [Gaetbulibacter sp. S0825]
MYKGLVAYSIIPVVVFLAFFTAFETTYILDEEMYSIEGLELAYNSPSKAPKIETPKKVDYYLPTLGKCFVGFKEALAFKESRGNYFSVNTFGYMGKYQFGRNTLKLIGIYNTNNFLNTPELQEKAFIANAMRNKWILRRDIKRFVGKTIDGVLVTESGILAAAHLAGPGSVKKYLRSYGAIGFADAYGTTIRNYMKKFSGYDTSFIEADKKAKATLL